MPIASAKYRAAVRKHTIFISLTGRGRYLGRPMLSVADAERAGLRWLGRPDTPRLISMCDTHYHHQPRIGEVDDCDDCWACTLGLQMARGGAGER